MASTRTSYHDGQATDGDLPWAVPRVPAQRLAVAGDGGSQRDA
jgi:hypothetical protein